ncbi:LOW QUALITY PROTEIN: hypothetical protein MC885_015299, partial [Smutsia gigantea]
MKHLRPPRAGATATSAPSGPETGRVARRRQRRRLAAAVLIAGRPAVGVSPAGLRSSAPPEGGEARRALGGAGGPRTAACAEVRPSRRGRRAGTQPSQLGLSAGRPPPPPGQSPALRYPRRAGSTVITPPRPRLSPFCTHIRAGGTDTPGPDPDPTRSGPPPWAYVSVSRSRDLPMHTQSGLPGGVKRRTEGGRRRSSLCPVC